MSEKPILHYVPSSHWDREWYLPFQYFRHKLVSLLDEVLAHLEDGTFVGPFTGDGQAILIEDYLEIRPEKETELRERIKAGDIVFGPWYVLPDEFLVSGESLLRNIRYGRQVVSEFGGVSSDAGFVCDLFGHNSQMPQILAGFGIRGGLVWRGVDARGGARIDWIGADGKRLPTFRFGKSGYCDYTYKVRHSTEPLTDFDADRARRELKAFCEEELDRVDGGPGLIFDGGDHLFVDFDHYAIMKEAVAESGADYQVIHSTLDAFLDAMIASEIPAQRELIGELREPARWPTSEDQQFVIPGVTSGRIWIKQENAECETLLCQWLEPFALTANRKLGLESPDGYLRTAWKWLLKNHPHDSICGCSVDQVHEDMKFRFSQCRQIAEVCLDQRLKALGASAPGNLDTREQRVTVFNPLPEDRDEVLELNIDIPSDWPEFSEFFGYEQKPAFRLLNEEGKEIPYQRLATYRNTLRNRTWDHKFPNPQKVHVVRIAARLKIPAMGQLNLRVAGQEQDDAEVDHLGNLDVIATRYPSNPGLRTGHTRMENDDVAVEIQSNGGLRLEDKRTGKFFENLNLFESDSDIGDGWYHGPTVNRHDVLSGAGSAQVELECDTPLLTRFVVRQKMELPAEFDTRTDARSNARETLLIESRVTLRSDADSVEVETRLTNTAGDHRLRAIFPSGVATDVYLADTPFDVVERPIALRPDNHLYRELEVDTKPQQSWTALSDDDKGLAIVCGGGLLETAVLDRPDRAIALTLFRATRRTVMTDGEPEGQLFGRELSFKYRLVPLSGGPVDRLSLYRHAQDLAAGVKTVQFDARALQEQRAVLGDAVTSNAILRVSGAVLTSCRMIDGAVEIRVFNPCTEDSECKLQIDPSLKLNEAAFVDFESETLEIDSLTAQNGVFEFSISTKAIRTLRIEVPK